jgi:hypothetical protein
LEFKYCFSSVAESLYLQPELFQLLSRCLCCYWSYFFSAAGAAFSVASVFVRTLSESPSTIAYTKDKILSIDLEASSFDGITNYSRGSELVSTIAKLECLILSFFIAMCSALISTTNNAAGNLDISEIEPKFFL